MENLICVQDEVIESPFADQLGTEQQLAAGAPQVGNAKTGDLTVTEMSTLRERFQRLSVKQHKRLYR